MKLNFAKKTKIRIIIGGIALHTTVGKYAGLFENGAIVNATLNALLEIQKFRETDTVAIGLVGRFCGVDIQVDLV